MWLLLVILYFLLFPLVGWLSESARWSNWLTQQPSEGHRADDQEKATGPHTALRRRAPFLRLLETSRRRRRIAQ
jgi:hypothetical protein